MKIYLVRHGETDWNKEGRMQGREDIPLNESGIRLAEVTSDAMRDIPVEIIFSSPLRRANQTAQIMRRGRDIPIVTDGRLQEMSFGCYEGSRLRDAATRPEHPMHNFLKHPERYRAGDGEDFTQVIGRARGFIEEVLLPAQDRYETVMIASHGALIRCFLMCIEERPLSEFWNGVPQKNCAVSSVELRGGSMRILEEGRLYYSV